MTPKLTFLWQAGLIFESDGTGSHPRPVISARAVIHPSYLSYLVLVQLFFWTLSVGLIYRAFKFHQAGCRLVITFWDKRFWLLTSPSNVSPASWICVVFALMKELFSSLCAFGGYLLSVLGCSRPCSERWGYSSEWNRETPVLEPLVKWGRRTPSQGEKRRGRKRGRLAFSCVKWWPWAESDDLSLEPSL
jgi:hypothetical protein